ncbi:hypothetical protein ES695_11170 [Candidatus Atribacteria bacterium 1244-E10-H5-B2]|nr:MAG: hypothetical protein ES695_11170 [Candidatus Atribacteria bacterium 1244-E10-H5-B2]
MTKKWRSAESYLGNTAQARRNQRANLIPGNAWDKRHRKELRLECFWEYGDLNDKQMIYEGFENKRDIKDVPKKELKDEKLLDIWWGELDLEDKESINKEIISWQDREWKAEHSKRMQECLKKKLALLEKV